MARGVGWSSDDTGRAPAASRPRGVAHRSTRRRSPKVPPDEIDVATRGGSSIAWREIAMLAATPSSAEQGCSTMADPSCFEPPMRFAACDHGVVYRDDRAFCGWPFYCGLWKVPDGDVVAGFKNIPSDYA